MLPGNCPAGSWSSPSDSLNLQWSFGSWIEPHPGARGNHSLGIIPAWKGLPRAAGSPFPEGLNSPWMWHQGIPNPVREGFSNRNNSMFPWFLPSSGLCHSLGWDRMDSRHTDLEFLEFLCPLGAQSQNLLEKTFPLEKLWTLGRGMRSPLPAPGRIFLIPLVFLDP